MIDESEVEKPLKKEEPEKVMTLDEPVSTTIVVTP
jgi:hypothetical protein